MLSDVTSVWPNKPLRLAEFAMTGEWVAIFRCEAVCICAWREGDMEACYTRLFADEQGESCFEDISIKLEQGLPVQGIDPLAIAPFLSGEGTFWAGGPKTWKGDVLHPAPRRFLIVTVQGEYEVTTSKGDARRFPRGSVLLAEDTTGKGHSTKVIGDEDVIDFCVALPAQS